MQERYLGDSHDFIKYALLRHLNMECSIRIGVNWHLTSPEMFGEHENNHGQKRHHLNGRKWIDLDSELHGQIAAFDAPESRSILEFQSSGILPGNTLYFTEYLRSEGRESWHDNAVDSLTEADLVFLDPDTGFQVKSMTGSKAPKYTLYGELKDYIERGQDLVCIQFARQCDPVKRATSIRERLLSEYGNTADMPILRGRVAPNLLFFFITQEHNKQATKEALDTLSQKSPKLVQLID